MAGGPPFSKTMTHRSQPRRLSGTWVEPPEHWPELSQPSLESRNLQLNKMWCNKMWCKGFRGSWCSAHKTDLLKCFHSWYEAGKRELTPSYCGLQSWNGRCSAPRAVLRTPIQSWEQDWLMPLMERIKTLYCHWNNNVSLSYSNSP